MPYNLIVGRNESDLKKYGERGTVLIGRTYVKMGRVMSLSNYIYLDVAKGHVVYIVGKRGSGKCLHGDTLITLSDGSQVKIKDLENVDKDIFTLDKNNIKASKRTNFYKRKVQRIVEVRLKSGKWIKLTPEHPLLTKKGWLPVDKLNLGNVIATPKRDVLKLSKEKGSHIFWDEIVSLKYVDGPCEVYDITVPKTHNFVANDIIVHNSYTMGGIIEGMIDLPEDVKKNLSIILLDTMGIYWTMKYPNEKDAELLEQWGLKGKGLDVKIYTPYGFYDKYREEGIPTDYPFSIKASALSAQDWALTFELPRSHPVCIVIEKIIGDFADARKDDYTLEDMMGAIEKDKSFADDERNEAINRLRASKRWGLFSKEGMDFVSLAKGGQVSVLDVSCYATGEGGWGVKNLVIGLVSQTIFNHRMLVRKEEELDSIKVGYSYFQSEAEAGKKEQMPIVWIVIDEAHEFLPKEGKTAATDALVTIMREGRQPGVCLVMATQQPGKIHSDVMSQSDIVISHRLTAKPDVDALSTMSQSYLTKSLPRMIDELPRLPGAALLLDDNSERFFPIRVRPRFTWHGGEAPSAVPYKRELKLNI